MVYKEMYFNLADEVEKVICELFELGEECQAIGMCYRLIDKIEECEEMYYKQCKTTEEMIAFGDDFNDIGMLKLCGKGIAMGNAIKEVKAVANDITKTNNEDGVAYYLEKNFLQ